MQLKHFNIVRQMLLRLMMMVVVAHMLHAVFAVYQLLLLRSACLAAKDDW
jgi:hypothetical protein